MGERLTEFLRNVQFPLWPDSDPAYGDVEVAPHPDGRPWLKACAECALRTSDPQEMGERYQERLREGIPGTHFYCVHRLSDERHRVCACYAALHHAPAPQEQE